MNPRVEDQEIKELLKEISRDLKKIVSMMDGVPTKKSPITGYIDRLDVEKLLGKSESTVRRYTADGTLKARKIGRTNWYKKSAIFKPHNKSQK